MANDNATNYGVAPKTAPNVCDACGIENPPGEEICMNCGATLVKKTALPNTTPTAPGAPGIPSAPSIPNAPKIPSAPPLE